jgi:predicted nucleic acid-binding protein
MRRYLLDTTPFVAFLRGRQGAIERLTPWLDRGELATSILVYAETVEWLRSRPNYPAQLEALEDLLTDVYPYWLTLPILRRYSEIRRDLRGPRGPGIIGDIDTLIAATALERDLILVTSDTDYLRVPGLKTVFITRDELRGP